MPGPLAYLLQAGATLVLDASSTPRPPCESNGNEVVVCARSDRPTTILPFSIGSVRGTVLVEPSGPRYLSCNPDFIARAGIASEDRVPIGMVGPVEVVGNRAELPVRILDTEDKRQLRWSEYRPATRADCVTGPRAFDYRMVVFQLGRDRADAVDTVLRFDGRDSSRIYATLPVGKAKLPMRIELAYAGSVLTAPAARMIAPILGASVTGPAREEDIIDGVTRPVRTLELRQPLRVGPVAIPTLSVRIDDYGRADQLRTLAPDERSDEGDIVVRTKAEAPGAVRLLRVGRDAMAGCVSITLDLRKRTMTLRC